MTRFYSDGQWLSFAWSSVMVLKDVAKYSWSDTGLEKLGSDFCHFYDVRYSYYIFFFKPIYWS